MNLKELEKMYDLKKEVESVKDVLVMVHNDINNPSGSVSTIILRNVLDCAVRSLAATVTSMETEMLK